MVGIVERQKVIKEKIIFLTQSYKARIKIASKNMWVTGRIHDDNYQMPHC